MRRWLDDRDTNPLVSDSDTRESLAVAVEEVWQLVVTSGASVYTLTADVTSSTTGLVDLTAHLPLKVSNVALLSGNTTISLPAARVGDALANVASAQQLRIAYLPRVTLMLTRPHVLSGWKRMSPHQRPTFQRPIPPSASLIDIVRSLEESLATLSGDDHALGFVELRAMRLFFRHPKHTTTYEGPFVDPYSDTDPATYFVGDTLKLVQRCLGAAVEHPVRARLADILQWRDEDRKRNRTIAIDEYLQAFEAMPQQLYRTQLLLRAAHLSGMSQSVAACSQAIRTAAAEFERECHGDLRDAVAAAQILRKRDPSLLHDVLDTLDRATVTLATRGDIVSHFERELLDLAVGLARETKQAERAAGFKLRLAQSHERTANFRAAQNAASALLAAARAYKDIGDQQKFVELMARAKASGELAIAGMKTVSAMVPVPHEHYARQLVQEKQENPLAVLWLLARRASLWPALEQVTASVHESRGQYFSMTLPRSRIESDGRVGETLMDDAEQIRTQIVESFVFSITSTLAMLQAKVVLLREAGVWSESHLNELFSMSTVMTEQTRSAIAIGIKDFEERRVWSALHVLVPQIERTIREISQAISAPNLSFKEKAGEMHWKTLTQLLNDDDVCAAVDSLQPDFSWHIKSLLIDGAGTNIRDNLSHGILTEREPVYIYVTAVIFILLILSSFKATSRE